MLKFWKLKAHSIRNTKYKRKKAKNIKKEKEMVWQGVPRNVVTSVMNHLSALSALFKPHHFTTYSPSFITITHSSACHLSLSLFFVTMQLSSSSSSSLAFHFLFLLFMLILSFSSLFFLLLLFLQWRHPNHKRLPPGSMGWPYIGETLKLYTENPNLFFSNRQKRYIN